ncbi:LamG-like jellyroll fold domain-containing protein [Paraburkholderia sp. CI3]|uniref:LamG-like jellyroll fold domain-containing protein n=1 Tax=Paraburkholderia sp. CI3 TaxID=2991060 RepID=UPI003D23B900
MKKPNQDATQTITEYAAAEIGRGDEGGALFDVLSSLKSNMSRRNFLQGLGALALTGCGAGSGSDSDTGAASAARSQQAVANAQAIVNGPSGSSSFVHPGLLHTQADLNRMAQKVAAKASPWIDTWNLMLTSPYASTSWKPSPQAVIYNAMPGYADNCGYLYNDVAAAYANALRWKIAGDTTAANTAVAIMNAWASTLTQIAVSNGNYGGFLRAGLQGYEFANAAELMRDYPGWAPADFAAFQNMMLNVFYPLNGGVASGTGAALAVYASWDLLATAMVLAVGVLCDNQTIFNQAISYFQQGLGNGAIENLVVHLHPGYLGQTQEAGRDQGHDTLSIAVLGPICEMAWNQGTDLYGYDNNRALAASEYVAKGNLIQSGTTYYSVPFAPYYCPTNSAYDTVFSTSAQGNLRPEWALIYNHYVNRKGIAAPYCQKFATSHSPEGGLGTGGNSDQLGYGTLTFQRDPIAQGTPPSGLTAPTIAGQIVLSWWGTAYATSYNVYRSTTSGGPYTLAGSGISDLLTYTDANLPAGAYYYVVTAITPSGETTQSSEAMGVSGTLLYTNLTFDQGSGTTASDATGNGNNGTLLGGATWAAGKHNTAVQLNGSGAYVTLPAGFISGINDFTIAAWVYWNGSSNWQRIFDFGNNSTRYMFLTPRSDSGKVRFAITDSGGGNAEQRIDGTAALPMSQWVHVAVTLSGATGTLYVNGAVVGTNTSMSLSPFQLRGTTNNWLGRSQFNDPYFSGLIDDFRVYNGAMSASDIATLASS